MGMGMGIGVRKGWGFPVATSSVYSSTVESGLIQTVANVGDSHDYTILGSTARLSSQLAREISIDCTFSLMFFRYFSHI